MTDRLDSRLVLALALGAFGFVFLLATLTDCGNIERAAAAAPIQQALEERPPRESPSEAELAEEPAAGMDPPTPRELGAALILGRYGANEAGFDARGDVLLIWQVAETHADDLEGRVRWLRRHSRCVVAAHPPTEWPPGNCRWARHLDRSGRAPRNWPRRRRWSLDAPRWEELLAFALTVVRGEETRRPCAGAPQTWDGRRWLAGRRLIGFVELPCSDPWTGEPLANVGYRFPTSRSRRRRATRDRIAARQARTTTAIRAPVESRGPF